MDSPKSRPPQPSPEWIGCPCGDGYQKRIDTSYLENGCGNYKDMILACFVLKKASFFMFAAWRQTVAIGLLACLFGNQGNVRQGGYLQDSKAPIQSLSCPLADGSSPWVWTIFHLPNPIKLGSIWCLSTDLSKDQCGRGQGALPHSHWGQTCCVVILNSGNSHRPMSRPIIQQPNDQLTIGWWFGA